MNPIDNILKAFPMIVLDGAMATELERHGCDLNNSLWSAKVLMENPEIIKQVHMDYFNAGADCAITASYQATIEGFAQHGLCKEETLHLIQESVRIARDARDEFWNNLEHQGNRPKPIIAASVGPYGAFLADGSEYRGDYTVTEDELIAFHRWRMKALIDAGAEVLACETIPNMLEAKAIVRLLEEEFPGTYAWISFSAKDESRISSGIPIGECAAWLDAHEQVAAIGINCTSPEYISPLIKETVQHTKKPIIVYPNLGEIYDASTKTWSGAPARESYESRIQEWYECGARLIGGCCRTKPENIKTISEWSRRDR
ncbi:homocysteine S-methyltransferase [Bacillus sp. B190/17]|uniref:Homocysteine S-methyltransferase n=1 Tax=Bacillus lumedeiriae TaxID=3058829 RepID=A0ABW8I5L3_9BACI